jgi:hypothetical protein
MKLSTCITFIHKFFHFIYFFANIVLTTYSLKQDVETPGLGGQTDHEGLP